MKTEQRKFVLKGEVDLALSNANSVFDKIQKFKNELSNLELPKDAAKGMEKSFERLQKAVGEFQILASRGIGSLSDSKEINKAWKSVQREINGLELSFKNIGVADIFPKDIQQNIKGATDALAKYADKVKEIKESKGYKDKLTQKAEKSNEKDLIKKQLGQATKTKIARQAKLESAQSRKTESEKQLEKERKALEALRKERELYIKESKKGELELKRDALIRDKYIKGNKSSGYDISSRAITADDEKTKEAREILAQLAAIEETSAVYDAEIKRLDGAIESESTATVKAVSDAQKAFDEINKEIESYESQIKDAEKATADIDAELDKIVANETEEAWKELTKAIKGFIGVDLSEQVQGIEAVQNAINDYQTGKIETLPELFRALSRAMGDIAPAAKQAAEGFGDVNETLVEGEKAAQEIDNLKNQVLDFFSLTNSVELFKRAIQSAIDTIKELDAVMTETAVVTDFSISDMWDKLPQYSKQASSLGSSIAELYSATTLYYQQGLKTNEAMGVGVETMKMARIANMDAEQATTAMTAALRGFNMEVNELNAQRVSDVYSELAAISAADTNQIATAMGKTASIAASANMEFETTAAFLTQIIETTQEAPETAGTALKTIVARFTEVKELFSEGMLTGQDTEGEEININKIDEALRTVGISLKDFLNGSKGMDDIFLELASKWDTLDLATQRYIATAAAGSRQQSRFIAMMSNYSRTVELVGAANNSAGASQEQYSKTLESLDTKLQQLKNAWDTFAMGLANDETIKVAVDTLRIILETINKIIDALSGGNGAAKSLISLGAAFGTLKIGGTAFQALFETIKQSASKEGLKSGENFATAFSKALKDKSGKSGSYIKSFFGNKELKGELTVGKSLSEALGKVDFDKFTSSMKKNLKESILEDFDSVIKLNPSKVSIPKDQLATLRKEFMNTDDITVGVDKLNEALGDTSLQLKLTENTAAKATATMEQGFGKAAAAAAGVGMALTGVAKILENTGHERGAEGFEALASGATILAGILTVLPGLLSAVGVAATAIPVVGIVVGVITALISGGIALSKWIETDTEKLERLNEEAKEAADAANEAKKAYDGLLSGQSDYEGLQKELEDLTRGTDEWRQKLIEANDQVLQLLETYPELAQYITRGEDGQLVITEEGWSEVQGAQEQAWQKAQYEAFDAKSAELKQSNEVQLEELAGELYTDKEGAAALIAAYEDESRRKVFGEEKQTMSLEQLKGLFESENEAERAEAARIWNNSGINGRFEDYYAVMDKNATIGYYSAELTQLAEEVGMTASQIANSEAALSKYLNEREKADIQGSGQAAALILSSTDFTSDFERKAGEGLVRGFTQNATEGFENSEEAVAEFNKLIDRLGKIEDVNLQDTYGRYLSLDAGKIGREDYLITGRSFLENMGFTEEGFKKNPEELKKFASYYGIEGETYQDFINGFRDMFSGVIATAKAEIETTIKNTSNFLGQDYITGKAFLNNATNDQIKAYSEILTQAYGEGEPTGDLIVGQLDKILAGAGDKLPQMLEYLAATDFRQEGAAASFIQWLKELGINLDGIDLNGFQKDLENLSKGFKRIDLKALLDETKNLYDLADDLKSRKSSEGLSQDEYDALISTGKFEKKDFYWTGQEWQYIGGSMEDLSNALAANTEAILSEKQQEVQNQIERGKDFENTASNALGSEWTKEQVLSGAVTNMGFLKELFGLDDSYSDAQVKAWYDEARFAYERLAINESQLADYGAATEQASTMRQDAGVLAAQGNTDALKAQAGHYDVTTAAIEAYRDALENADNSLSSQDDHLYAIGITLSKTKKILDDNASAWGDYIDQIKSGNGLEKQIAAGNLAEAVNDAFGASIEASDLDDVAVEMLQKWIDGSEEAGKEFSQILGKSMQEELRKQLGNGFLVMQKQIDALNAQDLTIGASISVDDTGLQNSLFETEEEMKAVMEYWNKMAGVTLKFTEVREGEELKGYKLEGGTFTGFGSSSGSKKSGGGGGGSAWKNPYDKFYKTIERINEELRTREKLERRYQQLLKSSEVSASKLMAESREQLASLEKEKELREEILKGREQEIQDLQAKNSDLTQYAKWNDVENIIEIDYELLAKLEGSKNEKLTTAIEEYIGKLEDLQDKRDEEIDAIYDIEDSVEEIKERGKDQYFDLENQVKDALIFARQNEIDKLQEINDTLNDTNSKLIGAIQDTLAKQRQDRENERTEEDLADKRARLSYLQMDTSGANALEIMELEEEIRQQEEDYTDSLIDQKISELEKQNDEAAQQRQHQIELMQYQLSFYEKHGKVWNDVYDLLGNGIDKNGIIVGSDLDVILKGFEGFDGMSALEKLEYLQEIDTKVAQALEYLEIGRQLENIGVEVGKAIKFYYNGKELEGTVDASGDVKTVDGRVFDNVFQGFDGKYYAGENQKTDGAVVQVPGQTEIETSGTTSSNQKKELQGYEASIVSSYNGKTYTGFSKGTRSGALIAAKESYKQELEELLDQSPEVIDRLVSNDVKNAVVMAKYATGGLADFTGPAWLDGTKSNPEYVLNSVQTKSFLQLVDILDAFKHGLIGAKGENAGDNIVDIDINIETVKEEADVDMLADKVQKAIVTSAQYRNNNFVQR